MVQEDPTKANLPREVAVLQGKEALWRLQADQKNGDRYPRSWSVRTVSVDIEVIKAYKDKWGSEVCFLITIY